VHKIGLIALHFSHCRASTTNSFHFYKRRIRGFLRWHRTNAVWIKGARVKRAAYLIINERIANAAKEMMIAEIHAGGYFKAAFVDPISVIREALDLNRETVGYLSYSSVQLGDSDEIFCPQDGYRKVTINYCRGESYEESCYSWDGYRCVYPKLTRKTKAQLQAENMDQATSNLWGDKAGIHDPQLTKAGKP